MYRFFYTLITLLVLSVPTHSLLMAQSVQKKTAPDTSGGVASISEKAASALKETIEKAEPEWSLNFGKILWSLIIFVLGYIVIRYLTALLERLAERWTNLRLAIKRLIPIFRITVWSLVLYVIIADVLAPPIATLVAVTASAGIAVGFASQDILKNIFGGIMILFDRPFQVGDKIEIGKHYGEVVSIGLRTVRIVTADDSLVAIPNSEIVNQSVSNANSGASNCQVVAEFYLPANIDLVKAKRIAYRAAATSRYIFLNKPIAIIIKNEVHQGRSLLKMRLKAYVLDIRYEFAFASEMTEIVMQEFLKQKVVSPHELALIQSQDPAANR